MARSSVFDQAGASGRVTNRWDRSSKDGLRSPRSDQLRNVEQFLHKVDKSAIVALAVLLFCIFLLSVAALDQPSTRSASVGTLLQSGPAIEFFRCFGLLAVISIGSASAGGMLGFLFGIPRNLQPQQAVSGDSVPLTIRRTFFGNTNLEEISDWLTKIIVGVGLIQAVAIYNELGRLSERFGKDILPGIPGSGPAFLAVLVASAVCGFLLIYLETRTRLTLLLVEADNIVGNVPMPDASVTERVIEEDIVITPADEHSTASGSSTSRKEASPGDASFLKIAYSDLETASDYAAWGAAQARAGNLEAAERGMQGAVALDPHNVQYMIKLADIRQQQGRFQLAVSVLKEALEKSRSSDTERILRRILYNALYIPQPLGFDLAKPAIDAFSTGVGSKSPIVQLWIAAAYGQRYDWLLANKGPEAKLAEARASALNAVRRVVELAPDPADPVRVTLRQIFDPERERSDLSEDDLVPFREDPAFQELVYRDAPGTAGPPTSVS